MKALGNHGSGSPNIRSHITEAGKILETMYDLCQNEVPENGCFRKNRTYDPASSNRSSTDDDPVLCIFGSGIYAKEYRNIVQV